MARFLALCLSAAVLSGGCAFGHAEPEAPSDPYAQLPRLLTLEAEIQTTVTRDQELRHQIGELGRTASVSGGVWTQRHAELLDVYKSWAAAAAAGVEDAAKQHQPGAYPPELQNYAAALNAWAGSLVDAWRANVDSENPVPERRADPDTVDRLLAARGHVVQNALAPGEPGHDYITSFAGQAYGPDWAELSLDGPEVFDDPDLWQQRVDALADARTAWTALTPPDEWANFHDRWSDWFTQHVELARLYQPGGFVSDWDAWTYLALRADRAATRARLEAEWLTTVAAAVDAAHAPAPA